MRPEIAQKLNNSLSLEGCVIQIDVHNRSYRRSLDEEYSATIFAPPTHKLTDYTMIFEGSYLDKVRGYIFILRHPGKDEEHFIPATSLTSYKILS
jgi:hypothetical protein